MSDRHGPSDALFDELNGIETDIGDGILGTLQMQALQLRVLLVIARALVGLLRNGE